jgi:peptidoglycan hydrolase-like protein with peptidoglycan-binding domain
VPKRAVQTIAVRVAPPAAAAPAPLADNQTMPEQLAPVTEGTDASNDPDVVADVQRGLNSLGFLHAPVDGVAGESTSKAIRNFEVYFNYDVTGRVTKQLVNLLEQNGAVI